MRAGIPCTPLGMGALFFLVDQDAELAVTMANRAMTDAEWDQYVTSPMARRKRKPTDRLRDLEREIREDRR